MRFAVAAVVLAGALFGATVGAFAEPTDVRDRLDEAMKAKSAQPAVLGLTVQNTWKEEIGPRGNLK